MVVHKIEWRRGANEKAPYCFDERGPLDRAHLGSSTAPRVDEKSTRGVSRAGVARASHRQRRLAGFNSAGQTRSEVVGLVVPVQSPNPQRDYEQMRAAF